MTVFNNYMVLVLQYYLIALIKKNIINSTAATYINKPLENMITCKGKLKMYSIKTELKY